VFGVTQPNFENLGPIITFEQRSCSKTADKKRIKLKFTTAGKDHYTHKYHTTATAKIKRR